MDQYLNIKAKIAYDGTAYLGWQKTPMGPSIESILQATLEQILQHPIKLQAASRTDAGVHAASQVVNFHILSEKSNLSKLHQSLNRLLPKDIVVKSLRQMPLNFHPTLDAKGKEYHYHVCYNLIADPFTRSYVWHYPYQLDIDKMREAANIFLGEHHFSALRNQRKQLKKEDDLRSIAELSILESANHRLQFIVKGENFLYKMVRNLVGTLIYVGRGKIKLEDCDGILLSGDRQKAGVTAPAHGLTLYQVFYHKFT